MSLAIALAIAPVATTLAAPSASAAQPKPPPTAVAPLAAAVSSAERLVGGRVAELHPGDGEEFTRTQATSTPWGLQYVAYERKHRGLPVVGGDFVVTTDAKGNVLNLSVAQNQRINVGVTPRVDRAAAARAARGALTKPDAAQQEARLVVHAQGTPRLAWQSFVTGTDGKKPSRKEVFVDAVTGILFDQRETVVAGTGTGVWNGGGLTIGTTRSGSQYTMRDPARPRLECADSPAAGTWQLALYDYGPGDTGTLDSWSVTV